MLYFLPLAFILGTLVGIALILSEEWNVRSILDRIGCRFGRHSFTKRTYPGTRNKYRCQFCNKKRAHPDLRVVDGGNKMGTNHFKF